MEIERVPTSLRLRLGAEATDGLLELLENSHGEWSADVIATCAERFDRRLTEEMAAFRVQTAQTHAGLRCEMAQMGADIRKEIASGRVEMLKWSFLFWIGQVVTIVSIMTFLLSRVLH